MRVFSLILTLFAGAQPLPAEPLRFPAARVLALAGAAWQDAAGFADDLAGVLPVSLHPTDPLPADLDDPYLWAISGTFGGEGAHPAPGALFSCARYGLATRDAFAERGFLDPAMFALMGVVRPGFDDGDVWPDGAVARLAFSFIWDDAETVAILPHGPSLAALSHVFAEVGGAGEDDWQDAASLLGEGGFHMIGRGGVDDSVTFVESGEIILTLGHQSVLFRSFLMGGGA